MAGHVPLRHIAEAIMERYRTDYFGDFKVSGPHGNALLSNDV